MNVQYRVGEAAKLSGLSTPTIRFYEAKGLLPPPLRSEAGYRRYDGATVRRLRLIRNARALGLGLDEVRALIDGSHSSDCTGYVERLQSLIARQQVEVAAKIAELRRLEGELEQLAEQVALIEFPGGATSSPDTCTCCPLLDEPGESTTYCGPGGATRMFKNSIATDDLLEVLSCDLGLRPAGAPTHTDLAPYYVRHGVHNGSLSVRYELAAAAMLTEFAAAETRCCSGLQWLVKPVSGGVELRISGTEQQLNALAAMWATGDGSL